MAIVAWVLVGWCVLSVVIGLVVGRAIARGLGEDL